MGRSGRYLSDVRRLKYASRFWICLKRFVTDLGWRRYVGQRSHVGLRISTVTSRTFESRCPSEGVWILETWTGVVIVGRTVVTAHARLSALAPIPSVSSLDPPLGTPLDFEQPTARVPHRSTIASRIALLRSITSKHERRIQTLLLLSEYLPASSFLATRSTYRSPHGDLLQLLHAIVLFTSCNFHAVEDPVLGVRQVASRETLRRWPRMSFPI